MRIVVGYDGSDSAKRALERAIELRDGDTAIDVVAAERLMPQGKGAMFVVDPVDVETCKQALRDAAAGRFSARSAQRSFTTLRATCSSSGRRLLRATNERCGRNSRGSPALGAGTFSSATDVVVLAGERLVGIAAIESVLGASDDTLLADLAVPALVVSPDADLEVATREVARSGGRTLAVVDDEKRFHGLGIASRGSGSQVRWLRPRSSARSRRSCRRSSCLRSSSRRSSTWPMRSARKPRPS